MRPVNAVMALLLTTMMMTSALVAQQPSDFVPIDPAVEAAERLPAAPMVMGAYALVWLVLLAYVWSLRRRQKRIELEMAALRARISTGSPEASRDVPRHP
jgi:CcmD family protein